MTASITRRATAELLGTFLLVFFGCAAVIMDWFPNVQYKLMGVAMVHAIILSIAVSMTMGISGGLVNPALTIGMWSVGKLGLRDTGIYVAAQLAGAVIAGLALKSLMPRNVASLGNVAYGMPTVYSGLTFSQAVIIEALLTFVLMSAVFGTAVYAKAPKLGGFGIGLTLFPAIMVGGPLTGAALNPARALGPSIATGEWTSQMVWWIGPILGAVIAAQLWARVLMNDKEETA